METDERLLPVPGSGEPSRSRSEGSLQKHTGEYPPSYSPMYDDDNFADRRSIREYFNVVYKKLGYILLITIITTSVAAFYMYRQPSMYRATTEMVIEPRKPKPQNAQSVNINFGADQNYYNTQLQLLQNPELMKNVIVELGLHKNPNLIDGGKRSILTTLQSMFTGGEVAKPKIATLPIITEAEEDEFSEKKQPILSPEESANASKYAAYFVRGLNVEQVPKTNLVRISIEDTNPDLAAKVSTAVAKVFMTQDIELATSGDKKQYSELTTSINDLRDTIATQEQQFIRLMQSSGLPLGEGKVNDLSAEKLSKVSGQLLDAIDERRRLEAQYNAALRGNNPYALSDSSGAEVASQLRAINRERVGKLEDEIRSLDDKIKTAEAELEKLRVRYTDDFVKVKAAKAEIDKLKSARETTLKEKTKQIAADNKKAERDVQKDITSANLAKLQAARKREIQLSAAYQAEVSSANIQGQAETKLTTLKREIETNRGLLDRYLQDQKTMELTISGSRPDNIKISAPAQTPTAPFGPQRNRNILIAFLVSLVGGVGLSFLLDYLDDSIRSSDDIGRHVGLPTLALIPHNASDKRGLKMLKGGGAGGSPGTSTALISLADNRSAMAEAYRHLRTSLLFSSAGKPPETILVTSSQPSEGKTTTAINTAITLAQSGVDVVLVDCDLRRPRLHSHFNMENTHGLTNYLSGERDTDNLLKQYPNLPNLKVITSGPIPPNPAELLSSNEMKNLLQFLRGNFKHVVIDSPPAISFTDAAILSTIVDGVVLVAMAGKSSMHLMRRFKQRLGNMGARIYGVVLNGIKPNSVEYGYYGYGYTYNYYNQAADDSTPVMEDFEDGYLNDEFHDEDIEFIEEEEDK
ncbi:MAG: polysaccharide biosynthesis tyrosine autokinase [Pyrinomonadaceae bacterium]